MLAHLASPVSTSWNSTRTPPWIGDVLIASYKLSPARQALSIGAGGLAEKTEGSRHCAACDAATPAASVKSSIAGVAMPDSVSAVDIRSVRWPTRLRPNFLSPWSPVGTNRFMDSESIELLSALAERARSDEMLSGTLDSE
jgi:hypothetical protein